MQAAQRTPGKASEARELLDTDDHPPHHVCRFRLHLLDFRQRHPAQLLSIAFSCGVASGCSSGIS